MPEEQTHLFFRLFFLDCQTLRWLPKTTSEGVQQSSTQSLQVKNRKIFTKMFQDYLSIRWLERTGSSLVTLPAQRRYKSR